MDVEICHFWLLPYASVSKRDLAQNLSNENEFDPNENEHIEGNPFANE